MKGIIICSIFSILGALLMVLGFDLHKNLKPDKNDHSDYSRSKDKQHKNLFISRMVFIIGVIILVLGLISLWYHCDMKQSDKPLSAFGSFSRTTEFPQNTKSYTPKSLGYSESPINVWY